MRRLKWFIPGLSLLLLTAVLLGGCGVAQTDYDKLSDDYEAAKEELAQMKELYPPRDFSSLRELEDWLRANDVSERPVSEFADEWYRKALEIQEDAAKDGYIISVDYDVFEDDEVTVWCVAIVNGSLFLWDPETDDIEEDDFFGTVK